MTFSYCNMCKIEVVDLGSTCEQGHVFAPGPVKRTPPPPPPKRAMQAPPPPPPAPLRTVPSTVWTVLEQSRAERNDPLVAFSPPPRMDWGPRSETPIVRSVRSLIDRSRSRRDAGTLESQTAS